MGFASGDNDAFLVLGTDTDEFDIACLICREVNLADEMTEENIVVEIFNPVVAWMFRGVAETLFETRSSGVVVNTAFRSAPQSLLECIEIDAVVVWMDGLGSKLTLLHAWFSLSFGVVPTEKEKDAKRER